MGATYLDQDEPLTKNRIKQNVSTSILLKAPLEVRDRILRCLLGDRMIHIQYITAADLARTGWSKAKDADGEPAESGLFSAFCVAEKSEQKAYDEANHNPGKVQAPLDPDYIQPCKHRHKNCLMCGIHCSKMSVERLEEECLTFDKDLSVLGACRLLYEESNNILWQTNTFSFGDPLSFKMFLAGMNQSQKHKLKEIHFRMDVLIDQKPVNHHDCARWAKVIVPRALTPLHNLKALHLSFDQYCSIKSRWAVTPSVPEFSHEDSQRRVMRDMEATLGLRMLPWKNIANTNHGKHVTVILSDDTSTYTNLTTPRWTKAQKLETAETLRARLAAPNAAEIHEIEDRIAQEGKKPYKEKRRRALLRSIEAYRHDLPSQMDEVQQKAERRRAEAKKYGGAFCYTVGESATSSTLYKNLNRKWTACGNQTMKMEQDPNYWPPKNMGWEDPEAYMSD